MLKYNFNVMGKPRGKARPRFSNWGVYTPTDTKKYESNVRAAFVEAYPNYRALKGFEVDTPLKVIIAAYFQIPKSYSKKKRELIKAGELQPTVKPDTDNICKIVLDALNGLAFPDDRQVTECTVIKAYTEGEAYVSVSISSLKRD